MPEVKVVIVHINLSGWMQLSTHLNRIVIAVTCSFACHLYGICCCCCRCPFSFAIPNPVISTGAIHSLTVNRAAEKPASLPAPHPSPDALSLAHSSLLESEIAFAFRPSNYFSQFSSANSHVKPQNQLTNSSQKRYQVRISYVPFDKIELED
jgi:hypothetical protein